VNPPELRLRVGSSSLRPHTLTSARSCALLAAALLTLALRAPAQSPARQAIAPSATAAPGTISGIVTDGDGDAIAGARITLTRVGQPTTGDVNPPVAIADGDGQFAFPNIPPGPFKLSIAAIGFAPQETAGELHAGENLDLPDIALKVAGSATSVQVTATQTEIAEAQINEEEKQRVLGVIPNFYVSYIPDPVPLTAGQKYELAFKNMVDPVTFGLNGLAAGIEQATDTYAWGEGAQGYAKRYAASYGTALIGDILGNAVLPIVFKQDPRYFYKGTGSIRSRVLYALANAVICKGDNHRWQPNYSEIIGGLAASGISNAYYPAPDRTGARLTFEGAAVGTGITGVANVIQELLVRKLTPHIPPNP